MKTNILSEMQATDDLITSAQNGSPEAAGELYQSHHPAIFRYLFYRTGDRLAAEDLTGDVFLKMVQALPHFTGGMTAFRAWLYQIARNLSIDHLRKGRAHPIQALNDDQPSTGADPARVSEGNMSSEALLSAINRLNDDQKDVLLLRFIEGLPLAETARTLHKSEDAVKGLQRRALIALRESLNEREQ
jgi:RNA polymerase sigma-70 factor (ECF subfamily)